MSRYRDNPQAIAALVQDDQVRRDVYIDPEIFEVEMERLKSPRGDEQQMYACTALHTLTVESGTLKIRLKRVNLLNCEAALPSIQLFS